MISTKQLNSRQNVLVTPTRTPAKQMAGAPGTLVSEKSRLRTKGLVTNPIPQNLLCYRPLPGMKKSFWHFLCYFFTIGHAELVIRAEADGVVNAV